ncbi:MAG TPA: DUF2460 domain-containing protein [Stellaceae bacterium]|nr:DUF2460 domain-containing protein [Stellaceae bacterium]
MSLAVLPTLIGASYPAIRTPKFSTRVQRSVSGREVRISDFAYPIWEFTLPFAYLPLADWQNLLGFFLQRTGAWDTFLFDDGADDNVTGQALGAGDGSTEAFQLVRTLGGFVEPILAPNEVSAVYLNGVPQASATWSVNSATGVLAFTTPPAAGAAISADFTYFWRCRFAQDSADFSQFMNRIWELKALKFVSVTL